MSTTTATHTAVSQLYVAMFGRAPDTAGLDFWSGLLVAGQSMTRVADSMFGVTPARNYFPTGLSNEQIIASFYVNVLGRTADAEGLAFWTGKLNVAGATAGSVITEMIDVIAHYAGTNAAGIASAALFNNRAEAAQFFGEHGGSLANATEVLAGVSKEDASVAQARLLQKQQAIGAIDAGGYAEIIFGSLSGDVTLTNVGDDTALRLYTGSQAYGITVQSQDSATTQDDLRVYLPGSAMFNFTHLQLEGFERLQLNSSSSRTQFSENVDLGDSELELVSVLGSASDYLLSTHADRVDVSAYSGLGMGVSTSSGTTVVGSSGADTLAAGGSGRLEGRAGDDLLSGGKQITLVGGLGKDQFKVNGPSVEIEYVTIEDFTKGSDTLVIRSVVFNHSHPSPSNPVPDDYGTWLPDRLDLGTGATFEAYLNAAASLQPNPYATISWFRFGGDAYMVVNNSVAPTFVPASDEIIKFTGMIDLGQLSFNSQMAAFF
ncbi:DUF4214 domain-containing protein [Ramlibacter sp. WS9]|uniref:DUF4214 domain-containing protein n=1 Tax=Ramlibacter sp. WS9 TaxID=1882741 RepID=UPI0011415F48|nr:DUF4214 domain-containing protein [Ramlibacter sp. WS9]ROZ61437.1 DUF4214 domain-containing protein [Ramlibacter sp. WS9]